MCPKTNNKVPTKRIQEPSTEKDNYKMSFANRVAEGLYNDIRRSGIFFKDSFKFSGEFKKLSPPEKSFWYNYSSVIPEKVRILGLNIRPFNDFCRTCIITDEEIDILSRRDIIKHCKELSHIISEKHKKLPKKSEKDKIAFFRELNYLIPVHLKKAGFEIIRREETEEINIAVVRKFARAIHSRYQNDLKVRFPGDNPGLHDVLASENQFTQDFDNLPDEIKRSNVDNAAHIPTKLLSIGYKIRPVKKGFKPVALHLDEDEVETMAKVEHLRWTWEKRLDGWIYGSKKDDQKKINPGLIPYDQLRESEKEKDRQLVKLIPAFLLDIKYEAYPVSPNRICKLSYAIKPQNSIQRILDETRELNDQIRKLVKLTPEVEEIVRIRNQKIEEAINEVEGSYQYAQHIQETFLPDDLYIRECFPDSFILYKPKDIVSGDFYFFSRRNNLLIFAVADCTGHGIPGALLSTLGYGILDQAVNEIKLIDPGSILHHLYSRMHRFLRNDSEITGISDDMDISLCILDTTTNILTYSGINSCVYHISGGKLTEIKSESPEEECGRDADYVFPHEKVKIKAGDTLYLCSDGYTDQFGGKNHKKYQKYRFREFLLSIQDSPMTEQSDRLYEEFEQWKEEKDEDQTDDILVLGIKI
jgi:serine phosphatase RsbU (regulator of sigma subunit)